MKRMMFAAALASMAGCAMNDPVDSPAAERDRAGLAAALEGYAEAGPPVSCVNQRDLGGNRSAGEGAIVFQGRSRDRLWVNRPAGGCPSVDMGRALVTRTPSTQLCRGDIATVVDLVSGTQYGGCGLGDFTPYRRVR